MTIGTAVLFTLLSLPLSDRDVTPNAPVDCYPGSQACTGTECVNQQRTFYCYEGGVEREITCQWDLQYYTGAESVCCTGRNICDRCLDSGGAYTLYSYQGVTMNGCIRQ